MKIKFLGEIILSIILIGFLIFFINPMKLFMPESMYSFMLPVLVLLFVFFTAFFWKEKALDERESLHHFIASRFAYFAGVTTVLIAIVLQCLHNVLDPWLVITICVMLLAKICGLFYGEFKK